MEVGHLEFLKHLVIFKRKVYLDYNATTNVSRKVRRKMNRVLKYNYGNPSSLYGIARKSAGVIEEARQHTADAINAKPNEIYFTGCATESNNAVLKSLSNYFYPNKKKIISTPIEHPSVINTLEYLKTQGINVEYCPVDTDGRISLPELERMIDADTFLICCMLANNEIGTIQNIPSVTKIAHKHDILVFSDCVQAFGKIPIDVQALDIDYASFSAHKLYGPKGIGALFIKQDNPFAPFIHGGHQENGMRAGTESIHNIAGFGDACKDINKLLNHAGRIAELKDQFIRQLRRIKPDCIINTPVVNSLPNTINVTFPGISNTGLLAMLDFHGIAVSAGSACSTQEDKSSHVLKAIGLSDKAARESVRFSLGCGTSARDIRYTIIVLHDYFKTETMTVDMITPAQVNETVLFDDRIYLLDVRPDFLRKKFKSLPNAHEASFFAIEKYLHHLPKDKRILVVCQHGNLSFVTSYYLKSKGFDLISSLRGGVEGWKKQHSDLYKKYSGYNITVLQPAK